MNCQLCQKFSDAYYKGNLPDDTKTQVEDHLATCNECAESYKILALADRVINEEKELLSNPFLITRIMERIENIETPLIKTIPVYKRIIRPVIITASLAAAIFMGIMIGNIYKPGSNLQVIPLELALIDDASIESVNILSNE
jgi:anti-sigma factor RsiW